MGVTELEERKKKKREKGKQKVKQAERNRRITGKEDERNEKKSDYRPVRYQNICCFTSHSAVADF